MIEKFGNERVSFFLSCECAEEKYTNGRMLVVAIVTCGQELWEIHHANL